MCSLTNKHQTCNYFQMCNPSLNLFIQVVQSSYSVGCVYGGLVWVLCAFIRGVWAQSWSMTHSPHYRPTSISPPTLARSLSLSLSLSLSFSLSLSRSLSLLSLALSLDLSLSLSRSLSLALSISLSLSLSLSLSAHSCGGLVAVGAERALTDSAGIGWLKLCTSVWLWLGRPHRPPALSLRQRSREDICCSQAGRD